MLCSKGMAETMYMKISYQVTHRKDKEVPSKITLPARRGGRVTT